MCIHPTERRCGKEMGRRAPPCGDAISETALACVFAYIEDAADRSSVSLVCKKWHNVDAYTRKDITIACCYAIDPSKLTQRFKVLESVKLKGKPRCSMFKLIPEDWGGYAKPWLSEISVNCICLKSLHLRRMVVTDTDLFALAGERGHMLQVLKLDRCSHFSTTGLEAITKYCSIQGGGKSVWAVSHFLSANCLSAMHVGTTRDSFHDISLRVLFLDESCIEDKGGKWLHELALHNSSLEVLSFCGTELHNVSMADLVTIAVNCRSLYSLKLSELELESLRMVLNSVRSLRELGGFSIGSVTVSIQENISVAHLPSGLTSLVGFCYMGADEGDATVNTLVQPIASGLKKVDLQCAFLSVDGHCQFLGRCSNLEVVEVLNAIGDEGLEVISQNCKHLRRLRVERGDRDVQQGFVTQKGLISVAANCHNLEYIAAYVSDINNAALLAIAANCPKLRDFRLVLLDEEKNISDFPLDVGVRTLMQKCVDIHRFALYLRPGFLTDRGMEEIGIYGKRLRWALFGLLGETDRGIRLFADACQNLERLEIRDCVYTEAAIAASVLRMESLKYVWVQGYKSTTTGQDLLPLRRASWSVEFIPAFITPDGIENPMQFLAYRTLTKQRMDNPQTVICLGLEID